MDIQGLLNELNQTDEHNRIEAKVSAKAGNSLLETVCAFSNEPGMGGGYLLLGVQRDDSQPLPSYVPVGVPNPDQVVSDLSTQCATMFNRAIRPEIKTEVVQGNVVIGVFVPEAQAVEKPIFFKNKPLPQSAWRRIGSTDQRCTDDDLLVLFEGRGGTAFDASVMRDATMDDLDPQAIAEYRRSRADVSAEAEELQWPDEDLLLALNCVRREPGGLAPTVAGILLFGKSLALRRLFPMTRVDYIRVSGREWVPDPENRFESTDMRGPLFTLVRRAQAAVLDDLPKSFHLPEGELQRTDVPVIPATVIREAIVNAVMHRNYRTQSPVQIIRYPNRLEIRNPGYSLKAEERLGEPGSMARNPTIAAVLHETRFAETKGSGIRVMRRLMEQNSLSPPLFESDRADDKFVAIFLFHHFLSPEDWQWLGRFKHLNLTDEEAKALIFAREVGAIDNASYRNTNHVDTLEASSRLRRLRDEGLLVQRGKGSATYYVPSEVLLVGSADIALIPAQPQESPTKSHETPVVTLQSQESPVVTSAMSVDELLASLPVDLRLALGWLTSRTPREEFKRMLLQLCAWRPLRAEELAALTKRRQDYLVREYLSPMVAQKELYYTIPQMPNHPMQAYQASQPLATPY